MPQPGEGCLPCQYRPKNPRAGCVSVEQTSQAVFTHALCVPDPTRHETGFHHGSLQELCFLNLVGKFMLQIFTNLCCSLLNALNRMVWWTSERALTQFLGLEFCALCHCWVTRSATLHPCPPCPPHGNEGAALCVQGLGAFRSLDRWGWSR